ncbi:tetratricopeptide repeat protein [Streptomyces virginiae]|uniref:Tetratricopeptide repeat protein n=1 Tax=Streptomyces virginiae TaxID=1961 RepID=A0ABZ1T4Q5_STRVG|nr:tetratricopeptide repeat protein [Streptomyces virginiae]WTB20197.1 tetratricopeptide repeat protein [Streptomyces virginiae]
MGNLDFHLDDHTGARAHLATATAYGTRTDDARLTAWALGAQSMVARAENRYATALSYAERAVAHAPAGLPKAQAHAWAQLTSLAGLGREQEADTALAAAARELEADPVVSRLAASGSTPPSTPSTRPSPPSPSATTTAHARPPKRPSRPLPWPPPAGPRPPWSSRRPRHPPSPQTPLSGPSTS